MDLQLSKKTALISGSTAGIGFAISKQLAEEGADVIINGRKIEAVEQAISEIKSTAKGQVSGFAGDLSRADVSEQLVANYPDVDILIHN